MVLNSSENVEDKLLQAVSVQWIMFAFSLFQSSACVITGGGASDSELLEESVGSIGGGRLSPRVSMSATEDDSAPSTPKRKFSKLNIGKILPAYSKWFQCLRKWFLNINVVNAVFYNFHKNARDKPVASGMLYLYYFYRKDLLVHSLTMKLVNDSTDTGG